MLPNTRIEWNLEIENDNNLIWRTAGEACKVVITRMQLFIPRITFNFEGSNLYMSEYLKPKKWTYLRENVERSNSSLQKTGTSSFRITSGISKPRHVFVLILNDASLNSQTTNPFLYNTFNVRDNKKLNTCHLVDGNGNEYPEIHYAPETDKTRVRCI